ncbi:fatty acid-binding protein 9-like [Dasypus novemcinctus]|uniref:fatty acid-binding protein 9-like n=1 Tax=Dasypus novemcinctus TaxID=9361 RepID=UPI00265EBA56|nr:fatty acid-binding protein 9-like [Dasypus novemcinctus]
MMVEPFLGTWKLISSENFDNYLKELEVSTEYQEKAVSVKSDVTISVNGDMVNLKMENPIQNYEISFKLGEEFDETTPDNRKVKNIITIDGGSMNQVQTWLDKKTTIRRQIKDGKMVVECAMNNVVSTRIYEKM